MNLLVYNSFLLALFMFNSIIPLIYKYIPIIFFKPEIVLSIVSIPLIFSLKKSKLKNFILIYIYILVLLFNLIFNLEHPKTIYEYLIRIIPFGVFPAIVTVLDRDQKSFYKFLLLFCNINFCLLSFMVIFKQSMYSDKNFMNYMTFGYWMQPTCLIYIFFYIQNKRKKYFVLGLISLILIFLFGSRFSFAGSVLGVLFLIFKNNTKKVQKKIFVIISIISPIVIIVYFNLIKIIEAMIEILKNFKISTISLQRLLFSLKGDGKIILTGRDFLYEETLKIFSENPIFGIGIFGFKNSTIFSKEDIFYPHNILLELFLQYGIFAIIILGIIFLIVKEGIRNSVSKFEKNYIYILIVLNFKLLLTGSYLWEVYFWILLTLVLKISCGKRYSVKKGG
ncbi:O-antigen ligase family protein [Cetobacterium sp.]|uniref:O-antigen ligase family protein n=1 Tax=Cetobacterium sp. TaxID=2071632 RepID=UPI003F2AEDE0